MDTATMAVAAAIAAGLSATAAIAVGVFTIRAAQSQIKALDFSNCFAFQRQVADAQRAVQKAKEPSDITFEYRELLNLLEAAATLVNERKVTSATSKVVTQFLKESWAWLKSDPAFAHLIASSVTHPDTFAEIQKFAKRHEAEIAALSAEYAKGIA